MGSLRITKRLGHTPNWCRPLPSKDPQSVFESIHPITDIFEAALAVVTPAASKIDDTRRVPGSRESDVITDHIWILK